MTMTSGAAADRRAFVATLAAGVLLRPRAAPAQPAGRVARVGYLTPSSVSARGGMIELRQRLRDLGYVEGRDLTTGLPFFRGRRLGAGRRGLGIAGAALGHCRLAAR